MFEQSVYVVKLTHQTTNEHLSSWGENICDLVVNTLFNKMLPHLSDTRLINASALNITVMDFYYELKYPSSPWSGSVWLQSSDTNLTRVKALLKKKKKKAASFHWRFIYMLNIQGNKCEEIQNMTYLILTDYHTAPGFLLLWIFQSRIH